MPSPKHLLALGACTLAPLGLIACGDSDEDAASQSGGGVAAAGTTPGEQAAETTGTSPEEHFAPDSEVAPGLQRLARLAAQIAAAPAAEGKEQAEGLEGLWQPIEGTVKRNEPDSYATLEEDLTLLGSGDTRRASSGATELQRIVKSYVAAHPG